MQEHTSVPYHIKVIKKKKSYTSIREMLLNRMLKCYHHCTSDKSTGAPISFNEGGSQYSV